MGCCWAPGVMDGSPGHGPGEKQVLRTWTQRAGDRAWRFLGTRHLRIAEGLRQRCWVRTKSLQGTWAHLPAPTGHTWGDLQPR